MGLVLAAPAARAELPVGREALGQVEAVLQHCVRVNPKDAERYQALGRQVTGKATDEELTEARGSAEYVDAHAAASGQLDLLSKDDAVKACEAGLKADAPSHG